MAAFGYIYIIKNSINNKVYIGQTQQEPSVRWSRHQTASYPDKMPLHRAIKKYGKDNFKFEVICSCNSIDDLNFLEIFFINYYNSLTNGQGYNVLLGGTGFLRSEDTEQKRIQNLKNAIKNSDRTNSINALRPTWLKNKGKKISTLERQKLIDMSIKKEIKCNNLKTNQVLFFSSAKNAAKYLNIDYGQLTRAARKVRSSYKNWTFEYIGE